MNYFKRTVWNRMAKILWRMNHRARNKKDKEAIAPMATS
jgi:hypothetical protein